MTTLDVLTALSRRSPPRRWALEQAKSNYVLAVLNLNNRHGTLKGEEK